MGEPRVTDAEVAHYIASENDPPSGRGAIIPALAFDLRDARAERDINAERLEFLRDMYQEAIAFANLDDKERREAQAERDAALESVRKLREAAEKLMRYHGSGLPHAVVCNQMRPRCGCGVNDLGALLAATAPSAGEGK